MVYVVDNKILQRWLGNIESSLHGDEPEFDQWATLYNKLQLELLDDHQSYTIAEVMMLTQSSIITGGPTNEV